eukprot:4827328-Amphidinium_carterae.1
MFGQALGPPGVPWLLVAQIPPPACWPPAALVFEPSGYGFSLRLIERHASVQDSLELMLALFGAPHPLQQLSAGCSDAVQAVYAKYESFPELG